MLIKVTAIWNTVRMMLRKRGERVKEDKVETQLRGSSIKAQLRRYLIQTVLNPFDFSRFRSRLVLAYLFLNLVLEWILRDD